MPSPKTRLIFCLLCPVVLLGAARHFLQDGTGSKPIVARPIQPRSAAPAKRVDEFPLDLHRPVIRHLDGGALHRYTVRLKRDQVLEVNVEQHGVDVSTAVITPGKERLFEVDSLSGDRGTERIFFLATTSGQYYLDIEGDGPKGDYAIRAVALREATLKDRQDARAEKVFYEAREIRTKHPDQAIAKFLEAEKAWEKLGNTIRRANALERVAQTQIKFLRANDWVKYVEICKKALALYETLGDQEAEARVLVQLGVSYRQSGDLPRAERSYRRAERIAKSLKLVDQEWEALSNMGLLKFVKGEYWEALDLLDQSLQMAEERDTDQQINNLLGRSLVLKALGKYNEAEAALIEANRRLSQPRDVQIRGQIRTRLTEIYFARGEFEAALAISAQALDDRRRAGDLRGEGVTLAERSLIYLALKDFSRARNDGERALAIFKKAGSPTEVASAHVNLGEILLDQKDIRGAMDNFSQGLVTSKKQGLRLAEVASRFGMARAEKARGNRIRALQIMEDLIGLLETMTRASAENEDQSQFLKTRYRSYGQLSDLLIRSDARFTPREDLARAFEATERADWRALLEGAQTSSARRRLHSRGDGPRLQVVWSLEEQIRNKEAERRQLERQGRPLGGVSRDLDILEEQLQTADTLLRRNDPWSIPENLVDPVSLRETQAMLGDDSVLLEFQLGEERSFLYFITSTSAEVFTLPPGAELEAYADRVRRHLSQSPSFSNEEHLIREVNELGEKLLGPVASRLGTKRLVIVPDGLLHAVSFALLPEPSSNRLWKGRWREPLVSQHEIVILPSASVLKAIRRTVANRKPPTKLLTIFGNPEFSSDYQSLRFSEREVEKIWALADPKRSLKALGAKASRRLATSEVLGEYAIIHFATHAENHLESPQLSSIILSQVDSGGLRVDGELRFNDIRNLYLPANLVVLSACETGLGKHVEGEGWVGLGHAFLYAGASRVISSLWNVNDRSTPEFMEQLYRGMLVEKLTPAQALRKAQLWMAEQGRSPYYWAGFQIQGEWR